MKCPKCQYLGYDGQTRCRHCGYDLSLAATTELSADGADPVAAAEGDDPQSMIFRPEPSARAQARAAIQKRAASRTPQPEAFDLPLFAQPGVDNRPALPASRPPLSVRRPATDSPRARAAAAAAFAPAPAVSEPAESAPPAGDQSPTYIEPAPARSSPEPALSLSFALDTPADEARLAGGTLALPGREPAFSIGVARAPDAVPPPSARRPLINDEDADEDPVVVRRASIMVPEVGVEAPMAEAAPVEATPEASSGPDTSAAPLGRRMLGGLVNLAVLAAVDAVVVVATLNATGLGWRELDRLPLAPLGVFLVLLAVGYLSMCTVLAGRTFGQSLLGLAVVEGGGRPVRLAPAVVRAAIQVLTVPAAGVGFLPALLAADRRALYDRLAGTDVVRDPRAGARPAE